MWILSFAKNMGKNLSSKYGQKLLDNASKWTADTIKTASKKAIQKTAEETGNLIGKKIADEITSVSKKSKKPQNNEAKMHITRKKTINYWWIKASIIIL